VLVLVLVLACVSCRCANPNPRLLAPGLSLHPLVRIWTLDILLICAWWSCVVVLRAAVDGLREISDWVWVASSNDDMHMGTVIQAMLTARLRTHASAGSVPARSLLSSCCASFSLRGYVPFIYRSHMFFISRLLTTRLAVVHCLLYVS